MPKPQDRADFPREIPLLPLRHGVLFPGATATLPVGRTRSVELVRSLSEGDVIGVGVQRDAQVEDPGAADLLPFGVYATVRKIIGVGDQQFRLVLQGLARFKLDQLLGVEPHWRATVEPAVELRGDDPEAWPLAEALLDRLQEMKASLSRPVAAALSTARAGEDPSRIADLVVSAIGVASDKEIEVLLELDVVERLRRAHLLIDEAAAMAEIRERIDQEVRQGLSKGQREMLLRQQLRAIQKELGEGEEDRDLDELRKKLDEVGLSEPAREVADRELKRLDQMGPNQPEYHVNHRYLELMAELPWDRRTEPIGDLDAVAAKLDADHHGLEDVKKRIAEHIAVRKLTGDQRGTILCLVGPPGVGKTSLGQSIADATGRPLARAALGGTRDEAEIRGHRRTYIGALPGRILTALRGAGVKNPVLLLDEIDKLGHGWMGSPEAALLEVLDPEQNNTFTDHYLDVPFDLSEVFFICTANSLETVSPPLRDRLEVIELQGYTVDEKVEIGRRHLLPRTLGEHGLSEETLEISAEALAATVRDYTREAGVRQLTRELTKICRAVTLEVARASDGKSAPVHVGVDDLHGYLGKVRFFNDAAERTALPGVVTGLAYTPVGGDILFVETSRMPGKGRIEITGQLGDVMKESARAALTYIRSHADALAIDADFLEQQDVHIHVPAGAVPKDGPSAGVTIFTALASLLSGRLARADTAMTGEVTLRGRVLPVGGIKAKVLAAHRAGLKRVILPAKNERDLDEVPDVVQQDLEFIFAENMGQVLTAALQASGADDVSAASDAGVSSETRGGEGAAS